MWGFLIDGISISDSSLMADNLTEFFSNMSAYIFSKIHPANEQMTDQSEVQHTSTTRPPL
jgi:hypothetical protein